MILKRIALVCFWLYVDCLHNLTYVDCLFLSTSDCVCLLYNIYLGLMFSLLFDWPHDSLCSMQPPLPGCGPGTVQSVWAWHGQRFLLLVLPWRWWWKWFPMHQWELCVWIRCKLVVFLPWVYYVDVVCVQMSVKASKLQLDSIVIMVAILYNSAIEPASFQ